MAEVIFVGCNKGDTYGEYGKTLWEQICVLLCVHLLRISLGTG